MYMLNLTLLNAELAEIAKRNSCTKKCVKGIEEINKAQRRR